MEGHKATTSKAIGEAKQVRANGTQIHYVEAGEGPPLLLLHGGAVSTSPIWNGHPFAYVSHMGVLAERFRVIAPDTRGCGRTRHDGGAVTFDQLADDVVALADALDLAAPALCGFSEGATTATIAALSSPRRFRAVVNHAGYDFFNAASPSFAIMRQMFGGSAAATRTDPDAFERAFSASPDMRATIEIIKMDQDAGGGPGYWKTYLSLAFERVTRSPGYTFDDLARISAPTLILTGDRDRFCSTEEAIMAFRRLQRGELAVLPAVGHTITPLAIDVATDFIRRHVEDPINQGAP